MSAALASVAPDMPVGVLTLLGVRLAVFRFAPRLPTTFSWIAPVGDVDFRACIVWPCECGEAQCPRTARYWLDLKIIPGGIAIFSVGKLLGDLDREGLRIAGAASWEGNA